MPPAKQFAVFILVGGVSAFIDVGLMLGLMRIGVGYFLAAAMGFIASVALNYFLHATFTFGGAKTAHSAFRFASVVAMNLGLSLLFVELGQQLFSAPVFGKLISLPIVAVNGFLWSKHWVFKR
jgi:putative flippase GtrA